MGQSNESTSTYTTTSINPDREFEFKYKPNAEEELGLRFMEFKETKFDYYE